ncbi:MAG TPA: MBL fold metallo-hydrolase [Candidatus Sulfotelmatobacter sp.]|jgi:hydroxyacylglutathione hydrolase|nr:MBL fold metallo-hydrolase [Candidatus Sulfotelmatobacter sp.]
MKDHCNPRVTVGLRSLTMRNMFSTLLAAGLLLTSLPARSQLVPGSMDVHWNEGAPDCATNSQPPIQVHPYNSQTFILRENPCATAEAPFMYLLVGSTKALLIDTGDVADPKQMPLAQTVMALLPAQGQAKIPLIVVHTHGHLDHRLGDSQFGNLSNVEVVPADLTHVTKYFGFQDWPNGIAQADLGGRTIDVIPTPGHYPSHVSYYDRQTGLLFSGDFLLPGRLIIDDARADLASAQRVADFVKNRPVSYVLGGHIELDTDGKMQYVGSHYHVHEHALQLTKEDLQALPAIISNFNGFYGQNGVYVLYSQSRILLALASVLILVLVACGMLLRWYLRRRKRIRANR